MVGKFGGCGRLSAVRKWKRNVEHTSKLSADLQPAYVEVKGFGVCSQYRFCNNKGLCKSVSKTATVSKQELDERVLELFLSYL